MPHFLAPHLALERSTGRAPDENSRSSIETLQVGACDNAPVGSQNYYSATFETTRGREDSTIFKKE